MASKVVAIVDGYSSGTLLAPFLKKHGYTPIHIQSSASIPEIFQRPVDPNSYLHCFTFQDWPDLIEKVTPLNLQAVIAGSEPGIVLADYLSEKLGLDGNATALVQARTNKYEMGERLKAQGVPHLRQAKVANEAEALSAVEGLSWPLVAKPTESAGTDNVFICHEANDLKSAVAKILSSHSVWGKSNAEVLLQEFADGTEYIVDSVSCEGKHFITDIWEYEKTTSDLGNPIYSKTTLLQGDEPKSRELSDYLKKVLDALGVQFGAVHAEISLTSQGPRLIEIGARMGGAGIPVTVEAALGYSQLDLSLECYLAKEKFLSRLQAAYHRKNFAVIVNLISKVEGELIEYRHLSEIKSLRSFFRIVYEVEPGQRLKKTVDLFTSPACIDLIHSDPKIVESDYQFIRNLEARDLYRVMS